MRLAVVLMIALPVIKLVNSRGKTPSLPAGLTARHMTAEITFGTVKSDRVRLGWGYDQIDRKSIRTLTRRSK